MGRTYITSFVASFELPLDTLIQLSVYLSSWLLPSIFHTLTYFDVFYKSLVTSYPSFKTSPKCIVLSFSLLWRPWLSPMIFSRGLCCYLVKEAMHSNLELRASLPIVNTLAGRMSVSSRAEATHAVWKDVS